VKWRGSSEHSAPDLHKSLFVLSSFHFASVCRVVLMTLGAYRAVAMRHSQDFLFRRKRGRATPLLREAATR
jgi:hypothetical protein